MRAEPLLTSFPPSGPQWLQQSHSFFLGTLCSTHSSALAHSGHSQICAKGHTLPPARDRFLAQSREAPRFLIVSRS